MLLGLAAGCSARPSTLDEAGIAGTYELEYRQLEDGRIQRPPHVRGLMIYTARHRTMNLFWEDADGSPCSIGLSSAYELDRSYVESALLYVESSGDEGGGARYDLSGLRGRSEVSRRNGELRFRLPLHDGPELVFDCHGVTARQPGRFVDYWVRVD